MKRNHIQEKILREYVRSILLEDSIGDAGISASDIADASGGGYGASYGGGDLYGAFIQPFVDVFKTGLGKTKEITRKAISLIQLTVEGVLAAIIPGLSLDYEDVFKEEQADLQKIRGKYKDVYDRTNAALNSNDAAALAFMVSPELVLGNIARKQGPKAAKEILSVATGGLSDDMLSKAKSGKQPGDFFGESQINEDDEAQNTEMDILTNNKFLSKVTSTKNFEEMRQVATELYRQTLKDLYERAELLLKKTNNVEDLENFLRKSKKKVPPKLQDVKKLQGEERSVAEKKIIEGVKKAFKEYYVKSLDQQVKSVISAGIPENSQYVKDFRTLIKKIESL